MRVFTRLFRKCKSNINLEMDDSNFIKFIALKATTYFRIMLVTFLKLFLKLNSAVGKKMESIKSNLTQSKKVEINFHVLTPIVIDKDATIDFYIKSLQWAIQKEDCYNIALMGIYGSGKSTVIRSFFKKHNHYKKVLVSLANYENESTDLVGIEKSIVQQIFYTVKESKLPNSGLKRIQNHYTWASLWNYLILCITLFLLSVLIYPKILLFLNLNKFHNEYLNQIQLISSGILLILCFFLYKKYRYFIQRLSIKFNLQNAEITLPNSNSKSIINEYLDELIYFFETNHYDIVVFEDLDRFDDKGIFSKLRELNSLLNNHESIKKKGKITFLYAVKDDIFGRSSNTTRTKFFDFILPVISVMNSSNSFAQIKNLLTEDHRNKLSDEFLKGISLYINDLRLLKNICNEFTVYKTLINDIPRIDYSPDNFFAMVVYKNYFPSDFNDLLKDQGELFEILNSEYRKKLVDHYSNQIQNEISEIQYEIENSTINDDQSGPTNNSLLVRVNELGKLNILSMPLSELITKNGLINFIEKNDLPIEKQSQYSVFDSELIQYLLKNGFIDENYQLYISHYIDGGLTKNDISFVLHVNEERETPLDYDFHLTFVGEILSRIQPIKYSSSQILNFTLVDYLIENDSDNYKKEIFQPISRLSLIQSNFTKKYIERGLNLSDFISELVKVNSKVLDHLIKLEIAPELVSKTIFDYLIECPESLVQSLLKQNVNLLDFISTSDLLFDVEYLNDDQFVKFMFKIKLAKFKNLNYNVDRKRLQIIEKEHFFEVNFNNITIIYNCLFMKESREEIFPILTKIYENWNPDSIDYLLSSENLINAIYSESSVIHDENEEYLLNLINIIFDNEDENQDEIEKETLAKKVLDKTSTIITDINSISNLKIQKYLLQNNRVQLTWHNVVTMQINHSENESLDSEIGDQIISFIGLNTEKNCLDFSQLELPNVESSLFLNFKNRILLDSRLNKESFGKIVESLNEEFIDDIDISEWNYDQIETLISSDLIKLSNEWVQYLRHEEWDDLVIDLYITRISDLIENYETFSISCSDLSELLISNVTIENKISLFLKYNFTSHNEENKVDQNVLIFSNQYFNQISFNFQQMMPILKFTDSKDQTLSKKFAIKLLKNARTDSEIKQIILGLNLKEFNSLWNYSSNMQDFQNSKENIEIFNFLTEKGLVGALKIRKRDGKLLVYKKKQK